MGWYLQFHLALGIRQAEVIQFLRHLLRHLCRRILVVWDHLAAHRGRQIRAWLRGCRRVHLEFLPPYAPDLNPNEFGWAHLKRRELANFCPANVEALHAGVLAAAQKTATEQTLLRGFVRGTKLPIALE